MTEKLDLVDIGEKQEESTLHKLGDPGEQPVCIEELVRKLKLVLAGHKPG